MLQHWARTKSCLLQGQIKLEKHNVLVIAKLRKIYVVVNILGNNFGVHATSFEVACFLVPSTVTVSENTFPAFCHLASGIEAPEELICISCYPSNNSYLEILSWLLPQA